MTRDDANSRFSRPGAGGGGDEVPDDEDDLEDGTSLDDLAPPADPSEFDRTFRAGGGDISFGAGQSPPIPLPWEGIPRIAAVVNLNYVYDPEDGAWVKKKPLPNAIGANQGGTVPHGVIRPNPGRQPRVKTDQTAPSSNTGVQPQVDVSVV